jgi:hypothetical protein
MKHDLPSWSPDHLSRLSMEHMEQYGTIWNNMEHGVRSNLEHRRSPESSWGMRHHTLQALQKISKVIKILYKLYKIKHDQTLKLGPFFWHP